MVEGHEESLKARAGDCRWSREDEDDEEVRPEGGGLQESQR